MAAPQGAFYEQLGQLLSVARRARGTTQEQLGRAVGMSRTSIVNIERGRQPVPVHLLVRVAEVLGVSPLELLPKHPQGQTPTPERLELLTADQRGWVARVLATTGRGDPDAT